MNFFNCCLLFVIVSVLNTQVHCQLSEKFLQFLLDEHNNYRQMVLTGSVKGQPKALKMPDLQWDQNISDTAQKWADKCTFGHDDKNDRKPNGYGYVGQNIAAGTSLYRSVKNWFGERKFYNYTTNNCTKVCVHYTQIVWASTTHLGCGIRNCTGKPEFPYNLLLVCNYYPGGNYQGQRPYTISDNSTFHKPI